MEIEKIKQIIEGIMFAVGREVSVKELSSVLELTPENVEEIIENMKFSTFHYNYKTDFDRKFCFKVMFSKLKVYIDHNLYIFTELYR